MSTNRVFTGPSAANTAIAASLRGMDSHTPARVAHVQFPFRISDELWPIDSRASLYARGAVRTFAERRALLFTPIVDEMVTMLQDETGAYKHIRVPASAVQEHKKVFAWVRNPSKEKPTQDEFLRAAVECLRYRSICDVWQCANKEKPSQADRLRARRRACGRRLYMICSVWGWIPAAWTMITSSAPTLVAVSVTGLLSQFPTEVVRYENEQESLSDLEQWIIFFLQVMAFSMVVVLCVRVINRALSCCRRTTSRMNRARFVANAREYEATYEGMDSEEVEYDSDQDSDFATTYYTMREKLWVREENENFFASWLHWLEQFSLYVRRDTSELTAQDLLSFMCSCAPVKRRGGAEVKDLWLTCYVKKNS